MDFRALAGSDTSSEEFGWIRGGPPSDPTDNPTALLSTRAHTRDAREKLTLAGSPYADVLTEVWEIFEREERRLQGFNE